jgi:glycosyltransferase involved in cell wall biosynthesis
MIDPASKETQDALSNVELAYFINSIVGKRGNIGLRFLPVIEALGAMAKRLDVYCRSCPPIAHATLHNMRFLGDVSRALNGLRIYVHRGLPYRSADVWIFETFCTMALRRAPQPTSPALAHVVETAPKLLRALKRRGYRTILEIPIAPQRYLEKLQRRIPGAMPEPVDRRELEFEVEAILAADLLICPSKFVADEIADIGVERSRIHIVPFATAVDDWHRLGAGKGAGDPIDFCFAGSIGYRKGTAFLLDAWRRGPFSADRLHLCGRVYPEGRRMIAECGRDNVIVPGFVATAEYFKSCDVYVLPSLMEGSSKSIYEAMNREMPVITTHESGSIVRDGIDGFIVAAADADALLEKMTWFKNNPRAIRTMGHAAKERVTAFTKAAYIERLKSVYRTALDSVERGAIDAPNR